MKGLSRYRAVRNRSADDSELALLLHERAVRDLHAALAALDSAEARAARQHSEHARRIFALLRRVLDWREQPDLARNLATLYDWAGRELARGDRLAVEAVLRMSAGLCEGWRARQSTGTVSQKSRG